MQIKKGNKYTYLELGEVEVIANTQRKVEGKDTKLVDLKTATGEIHTIKTYEFQKSAVPVVPAADQNPKGNGNDNGGDDPNGKENPDGNTKEKVAPKADSPKPEKPAAASEKKPPPGDEKKMNFWPIVVIILILVAIGVAYWWFNRDVPKQ